MSYRITQSAICCGSHYHRWTEPGADFPDGHISCAHCKQPLRWKYNRSRHNLNYERIIARVATLPEPFCITDVHPAVPMLSRNDLCSICNRQAVVGLLKRIATGNRNKAAALYTRGPKFPVIVQADPAAPAPLKPVRSRLSPYELAWRAFRSTIVVPDRPD